MKYINFGCSSLKVPQVACGCFRFHVKSDTEIENLVKTALENGVNFFDNADIYGGNGRCEELFAKAYGMNENNREKIIIQTKCGIRDKYYDFSKEHILASVEGSLKRLKTDYIDILLLHRPDALYEPEEVAEAFDILYNDGKVKHFGVSNFNPMQIALLQKYVAQPINANQLQLSITNCNMISNGLNVNMETNSAICRDGSILDFCRLNEITVQPWSPFQYGFFEGCFVDNSKFPELNDELKRLADKYGVTKNTIVIAWLLRHPAKFQPILGTTDPKRFSECAAAVDISLTREEWYGIYRVAGNRVP